ncbi:putative uncharacterized protein DDB_G0282133 [Diorhabda sublineata]|uniref:putative uncharacterized protein DDB_G0282133 n=1 Tax=Diorhabda sublineata TaxID=1163346 RepID=UPI0024E0BAC2|nr:putative uncharacterized protein DDB_G0282133 [Diorhabda sublineata]
MDLGFDLTLENPKEKAGVFAKLFFGWVVPLIKKGVKQGLQIEDLYKSLKKDKSQNLTDALQVYWEDEVRKSREKKTKPNLMKALFKQFYKEAFIYGFMWFYTNVIIVCLRPIILAELIKLFADKNVADNYEIYVYSVALIIVSFLSTITLHHVIFAMQAIGMRVRIATSSLVYRKVTRLSQRSLGETPAGKVVNILSNDLSRFDLVFPVIHALWVMPFQVLVIFLIIWQQVGLAAVAGVATMVVVTVPIQGFLTKYVANLRDSVSKKTDRRVKIMSEIVSGMQVIKMYAWEKPFEKLVKTTRSKEMKDVNSASILRGIYSSSTVFSDKLSVFATLLTYVLLGNIISADKVFSIAQSFGILQLAMAVVYPLAISTGAEALVSVKRLEDFLALEEKEEEDIVRAPRNTGITVSYADASWTDTGCTLEDINLRIPPGTLCAVVGPVGAGKSSLLQLLIGELAALSGGIEIGGEISYSAQQPWLFQSSVRNNILFGSHFDKNLYKRVVEACALRNDFDQLPHGDRTIVGEKGVSLSGGQRARINLARAVYRKADIYLLDDPLSAVDTHVGKHLFDECVCEFLKGKTRILVTHQLQYLKKADMIIVLNEGVVEAQGTFDELSECNLDFTKMVIAADETDESTEDTNPPSSEAAETFFPIPEEEVRRFSMSSSTKMSLLSISDSEESETTDKITEEKSGDGPNSKPFKNYLKSVKNNTLVVFVIILLLSSQALIIGVDQWLTLWTSEEQIRHSNCTVFIHPNTHPNITNVTIDFIENNHFDGTSLINHGTFHKNNYPTHRNINNSHYYYYRNNGNNENDENTPDKKEETTNNDNNIINNTNNDENEVEKHNDDFPYNENDLNDEHKYFDGSTVNKKNFFDNSNDDIKDNESFINKNDDSTIYYNNLSNDRDNSTRNRRNSFDIGSELGFDSINGGTESWNNYLKGFDNDIDDKYDFIKKEDENDKNLEDFNKNRENGTRNDEGSSRIDGGTTNNPRINYFDNVNKNLDKENESTKDYEDFFKNYVDSTSTEPNFHNINNGSTKSVNNVKKNIDDIDNKYDLIKKEDESIKKSEDFNKNHENGTRNDKGSSSINSGTTNNPRINYFDNDNKNFNKENESTKDNVDFSKNYVDSTSTEPNFYNINNGSTRSVNNVKKHIDDIDNKYDFIKKEDESIEKLEDFNKNHENGTRNDKGSSSINSGTTNNPRINYFDNDNKNFNKENESTKDYEDFFKNYVDSTSTEPNFYNFNNGSTKDVSNWKKNIDDIDNKYNFIKKEDESIKKLEDIDKIHENGTRNDEGSSSINGGTTNNPRINYFDNVNKKFNKENERTKDYEDFFKNYVDSTSTEPNFHNINNGSTKSVNNVKKNIDDIDNKYDFIKKEDESIKKLEDFNKIHENGTRNDKGSSSINSGTTNNPRINYFDNVNKNLDKENESTKDYEDFFKNYVNSTSTEPNFHNINNGSTKSLNNVKKNIDDIDNKYDFIKKEDESIKKLEDIDKIHENGTRNDEGSSSINSGTTNNPRINYFDNVNKNLDKENERTKDYEDFFKNYVNSTSTEPNFHNINNGSTKSVNNVKKNIDDIDNKYDFIKKEDESIKKSEDFNKNHENGTRNDKGSSSINSGTTNNPRINYFDNDNKNFNKENESTKDNVDFSKNYVDSTSTEPNFYNINNGSTRSVNNVKKHIDDIDNKYDFIKKEDESIEKLEDFNKNHENGTRNDEGSSSINSGTTNNPRINYFDNDNKNFNKENESTKDYEDFFKNYVDSTSTEPNFHNINNGSTKSVNNVKKNIDDIDNKYDFIKKEDESIKKLEDFNKIHENGTRNDKGSSSINSGTTNNPRINYFDNVNKNLDKENESTKDYEDFFKNYVNSTSTEPNFHNINNGSTKSLNNVKKNIDDIDNKYDFIKKEDESIKKLEDIDKIHENGTRNDEGSSSINSGTTNNPRINYFDNVNKNLDKENERTKDYEDFFKNYVNSTSTEPNFHNINNGSTKSLNNVKKNIDDIDNKYDFIKKEDESIKKSEDFNKNHENGTRNDKGSSSINSGTTNNPRINYFDNVNKNLDKENESTKDYEDFFKNYVDSTSTEPNFHNINNGSTKSLNNVKKNIDDIDNKYDFIKKEDESIKKLEDIDKIHENGTRNDEGSSSINSGTTNNPRINYFDNVNKNLDKENERTKDYEDFFKNYVNSTSTEPNFHNINNGSTKSLNNVKKNIDDIDNKYDFIKKEDESIKKLEDIDKIHENGTRNDEGSSSINSGTTNNPRINYFDNGNKNFNKENESTKDNMNFFKNYIDSTSTEPNFYIINNGSTKIENNWEKSNNDFNNKYNFTKKEDESFKNIEDFTKNHKNGANSEDSSYSINISSTKNPKNNHFNTFNNNFTKENESTKNDKKFFKNNGYTGSTRSEPSFYNINNSSTINKNNYYSNKNENTKYSEDFFKNHKNGTSTSFHIINNGSTKNDNNHYDNKDEKNIKYSDDFPKNKVNGSRNENNDDGTTKNENNYYNNKENEDTKHNDDFIKDHMNSTNSESSYHHKNGSTLNNSLHFNNKEVGGTKYREDLFKNDYNSTINNKFNNKANEGTKYLKNHMNSTSTEPSYSKNGNNSNKPIIDMFDNQKSTNNSFSNLLNSTDNSTENIIKKIMKKLNIRNILSFITLNFNNMYDYVIIDGSIQRLIKTDSALYIYGTLIILVVLLVLSRTFLYYMSCTMASENLHSTMFNKLLKAPMRFFDTNPSGRILNRFSKDIGCIDEILPRVLLDSVSIFLVMAGILINIVIANPIMIIILIILGSLYLKFRTWYMATAKTLKHLEGIAKSPVFSHVSSTICGIVTIRSSHSEEILINEFDRHQDVHTSAWYLTLACMNAFGLWLDLIVLIFLAIVTFSFVITASFTNVNGSMAGLAISQCMVLTGMLQYGMKQLAEVINNLTSVERVLQYTTLDNEGPFDTPKEKKPKGTWPRRGNIEFNNLYLKYVENEPPVLKNLNMIFKPGEKIGIVGRTGAGKSSLISALFRLAPLEGSILIDRVEIQNLGLTDLRKKISIIPQEPVLFSETLRYNLDPFGEFDDDKIWDALELVELKESVDSLDFMVAEGGANFSLGQRQLICLARAILKDNKILILDEATANVDQRTDSLIQATIRKAFKDCTVLTIAHRLNTIMDSDKVLVMSFGNMVEFDHPHKLLQIEDGYFHKLVMETSPTMAQELKNTAQKAYQKYITDND